jgi:hypothetical protein
MSGKIISLRNIMKDSIREQKNSLKKESMPRMEFPFSHFISFCFCFSTYSDTIGTLLLCLDRVDNIMLIVIVQEFFSLFEKVSESFKLHILSVYVFK